MRVTVTSNIKEVLGWTANLHPQFRFAVAKTLTDVVREVQKAMPAEVQRAFKGGAVEYTKRAFYIEGADKRKSDLVAAVGVKDDQAKYLSFQVEGGTRIPERGALKLPSVVDLTAQGNIPKGLIRQLIARANAGKRVTRGQSKRTGISQKVDLFYGEPGDGRPLGIYKRVAVSTTQHRLIPVVVFPKQSARYTDRPFDFYGVSTKIVQRSFDATLDRNWRHALATAR